jgi:small subunit ribosomal protein S21
MIVIEINKNQPIDKALKVLKTKVIQTKQNELLRNRKEYSKKSVKLRAQKLTAIYKQSLISSQSKF